MSGRIFRTLAAKKIILTPFHLLFISTFSSPRYDRCEPLANRTHDDGSAISICPHPWPTSRPVAVLRASFPTKLANLAHTERIHMVRLNAKANLIFQRVTDLLSSTLRGNTELRFSSKA